MELSEQAIHDVIHPTAIFANLAAAHGYRGSPTDNSAQAEAVSWLDSPLNPVNRIDSFEPIADPLWRIDGCTAFGSQFYVIPQHHGILAPLRVDLFIPEPATLSPELRNLLDIDVTFHTRDGKRIDHLGITRHLLRILQRWSQRGHFSADIAQSLPFGSRIVLNNLPINVDDADIFIAKAHHLERQLLPLSSFQRFWGDELSWPPTIDLHSLEYLSQIHDSTCLVRVQGRTLILKALTSDTKYLYHEMRQLLSMPPHDNVISRPVHIVTKACSFGGKVAVVGFTVELHQRGSFRDLIPFLRLHNMTSQADEAKWSLQLASAMLHLRNSAKIFYPDLRLDNIVLSDSGDAVMVDFEQRGVWCEFAAPEVNAVEYVRLMAIDEEILAEAQAKYAKILTSMLPDWEDRYHGEDYTWPSAGYNIPWECLTPVEQEACEVYMLGRVFWCIFEAKSAPQRAAVWLSYRWEPLDEFPVYTNTPEPMRELIDRCTKGRRPGLSQYIVRQRDKLVLRNADGIVESTAHQVQETAQNWWTEEMKFSEEWLEARAAGMKEGTWNENYYGRPSLREVHDVMEKFCKENGYVL